MPLQWPNNECQCYSKKPSKYVTNINLQDIWAYVIVMVGICWLTWGKLLLTMLILLFNLRELLNGLIITMCFYRHEWSEIEKPVLSKIDKQKKDSQCICIFVLEQINLYKNTLDLNIQSKNGYLTCPHIGMTMNQDRKNRIEKIREKKG